MLRKRRVCTGCGCMLATRQSLFVHKKTCGKGIAAPAQIPKFDSTSSSQNCLNSVEQNVNFVDQNTVAMKGASSETNGGISNYTWKDRRGVERRHSFLLPKKSIRAIIVGKSGYGKSTLLNYLLLHPGMLDYDTLTVCGRSLHQPEYRVMKRAFEKGLSKNQVNELFKNQNKLAAGDDPEEFIDNYNGPCKGGIDATFSDNVENIPDPSEHDPTRKNLLIFDDVMLGNQNKCEAYYTRGRHNNVDVFYIAQSYFRLPRQTVRENANLFILFKQDNTNLSHIYRDHCSFDAIPFEVFKGFCADVWRGGKHNFVTLDTSRPADGGKYRRNLNDYWVYDKEEDEENHVSPHQHSS